jgi:glutamyl-tRNA reductase
MLGEQLLSIGVNHKTTPIEIREKLAFSGEHENNYQDLAAIPGCKEYCLLSTCNRVEIFFVSSRPEETTPLVGKYLFKNSGIKEKEMSDYTYSYQGKDAVEHLFRVAASLDSMVVGEPQILGQLKQAYKQASELKGTGVILNRFFRKAFSVAKRVRTETNIGGSAVSISFAAVELAKKIFGKLKGKKVILVGAGEMAELAAQHLITQGVGDVVVANRTLERAVRLSRQFKGRAVTLGEILQQLEYMDIMISSTGAVDLILTHDDLKPVMRKRRNKPLFLIDIAVPRDLDPGLNSLDNVYLYDIDDLNNVVDLNKTQRTKEATVAERIVNEETLVFMNWLDSFSVSPTITAIREKAEKIRKTELSRTLKRMNGLPEKERESIEALSQAIVNKLLHDPFIFLKNNCTGEKQKNQLGIIKDIFKLE